MSGRSRESEREWRETDRLLERVLARPAAERAAFLDRACAGRPELRARVERLLTLERRADAWMSESARRVHNTAVEALGPRLRALDDDAPERLEGRRVGPYRIVRPLARGGMGTVWLAERDDGQFERRVAVKVLRRGRDTEDLVRRFADERRILASLDHPGIARLLDGGATQDGRPYLVMEYVEGRAITEHCRGLGLEARISLFTEVCEVVRHAHRNLVLHRDIKPSNILVAADGRVKLLDFGISRLLAARSGSDGDGADGTRDGAVRPLTPEYASPEQLRGERIDTASDVYQLGLLFYRLLTGRPAPRADDRGGAPVAPPPPPPSRVVGEPELRRRLRGDLDAIVLEALRPDVEDRYPSVERLLVDLDRRRRSLPVLARRGGWRYRTGKLLRRHPWPAATAAIIVAVLVAFAGAVIVHSRRIAAERNAVREQAARAEQVKDFVVGLFEAPAPDQAQGEDLTARQILDRGAERIARGLAGQPDLRAELQSTVARSYALLGDLAAARRHGRASLELRRRVHPPDHPDIARSLLQLGDLVRLTNADTARALHAEALEIAERAYGPDHPFVAEVLLSYGQTLPPDEGFARHDRALAILRARPRAEVADQLASTLAQSRSPDAAERVRRLREALALRGEVSGEESLEYAAILNDLALGLAPTDTLAADTLMARAMAIYRRLAGDTHPTTLTITNNWAAVLRDYGRLAAAESLYRRVLALRRTRTDPVYRINLGYTVYGLGRSVLERGRAAEAEPLLREALEIFPDSTDSRNRRVRIDLGRALTLQDRLAQAESVLVGVHGDILEIDGSGPDEVPALRALVELYRTWARPAAARPYRQRLDALRPATDVR